MALPLLRLGSRGTAVRLLQQKLRARGHTVGRSGADGVFGAATLKAVRAFQRTRKLQVDGVVGPRTWAALGVSAAKTPTSAAGKGTGRHLAAVAHRVVTGGYGHTRPVYRFGAEQSTTDLHNPASWRNLDCSEFTQGLATVELGKVWIDGARFQYAGCKKTSVAQAIRTPGALLFIHGTAAGRGSTPFIFHVAVSLGDGRTAELRSTAMGAGIWSAHGRFNLAGLIPGIRYG